MAARRSENREKSVACVLVDVSAVPVNQRNNPFEEAVESRHDLDRTDPLGEGGEAAHVDEHQGDLHLVSLESGALKNVLGDIAIDVRPEHLSNAFPLSQTRRHRVETDLQAPNLAGVVDENACREVTGPDPGKRVAQFPNSLGDGPRSDEQCEQSDHERDDDETQDRGQRSVRLESDVRKVTHRERRDAEERHPGRQRPRHRQPELNARPVPVTGRATVERARRHRSHDPLGDQIPHRRRGDAAQYHCIEDVCSGQD